LTDKECVLYWLLEETPEDKETIIKDLMGFLVGASDTSPSVLCQGLLRL